MPILLYFETRIDGCCIQLCITVSLKIEYDDVRNVILVKNTDSYHMVYTQALLLVFPRRKMSWAFSLISSIVCIHMYGQHI